jgi:ubiquinone/menaquinone biosynthesis C-methylase UbiE
MRATWDALAAADTDVYVGDPARARRELDDLFGRLGDDPRGGVCVEVGCGPGRMTGALAARFERVLALDVSPAMVDRAREAVPAPNVEFRAVSGVALDGVPDGCADVVVCYLVLQHLPRRRLVARYLEEFARVLAPGGRAFVQLPVLRPGLRPRLRRGLRTAVVPLLGRSPERAPAFRGVRLTGAELARAVAAARLTVTATDRGPDAPYRHSEDVFLRLERAG